MIPALPLLIVGLILFLAVRKGRRCANERVAARPRPLGVFPLLVIGAFCCYFLVWPYPKVTVRLDRDRAATREARLDRAEEEAIHRRVAMRHVDTAKSVARAERDRVKQIIAEVADDAKDEIDGVSRKLKALFGDDAVAAEVEPATAVERKAETEPVATNEPKPTTESSKSTSDTSPPLVAEAESASTPAATGAPRPNWVDEPAGLTSGVYYKKIVAGPYSTRAGCEDALPAELTAAVDQYIETYLGAGASQRVHLSPSYIQDHIRADEYEETYDASFGPMKNLHVRLAFDRKVNSDLQRMYHATRANDRMKEVALGAGGVLLLLGTMFGYLKLDTATRGYYTGRLRLAALLVLLGGGAAALMLGF